MDKYGIRVKMFVKCMLQQKSWGKEPDQMAIYAPT